MSEAELATLKDRVAELERKQSSIWRGLLQFGSPLIVVALGGYLTYFTEAELQELEEIQVAERMLPALFSEDEYRALATKRLLDEIIDNEELKSSLNEIVTNYLQRRVNDRLAADDPEAASNVYRAATEIGGTSGEQLRASIDNDKGVKDQLTRYDQARSFELNALSAIAADRLSEGLEDIRQAEEIYPNLHSVKEIRQLLESRENELEDRETQDDIKQTIVTEYSWKIPPQTLEELRSQ
ncbi:MAG: hypothetical protein AAF525_06885 [Pseudomonadota bacterium]